MGIFLKCPLLQILRGIGSWRSIDATGVRSASRPFGPSERAWMPDDDDCGFSYTGNVDAREYVTGEQRAMRVDVRSERRVEPVRPRRWFEAHSASAS